MSVRVSWFILQLTVMSQWGSKPSLDSNMSSPDDLRLQDFSHYCHSALQLASFDRRVVLPDGEEMISITPIIEAPKGIRSAHKNATSASSETRTQMTGPYFVIPTRVATPPILIYRFPNKTQNNTAILPIYWTCQI